eukprot:4591192-Amphidinium_carterae.2
MRSWLTTTAKPKLERHWETVVAKAAKTDSTIYGRILIAIHSAFGPSEIETSRVLRELLPPYSAGTVSYTHLRAHETEADL